MDRKEIENSLAYKASKSAVDWYQAHQDADCLDGFEAGAQWQREQMMKDAKDATIRMGRAANFIEKSWELDDYLQTFHSGQKVKVIIIKE